MMKQINHVLAAVSETGYGSFAEFLTDLMTTKDQMQLSQVSKILIQHGMTFWILFENDNHPWLMVGLLGFWDIIGKEVKKLADYLCPEQGQEVSEVLANFSLARILSDAKKMVSNFCELL
jgi:hypothetical protein